MYRSLFLYNTIQIPDHVLDSFENPVDLVATVLLRLSAVLHVIITRQPTVSDIRAGLRENHKPNYNIGALYIHIYHIIMYNTHVATILSRFMGHERFNANKYSYISYLLYAHIFCNSAMLIGNFVLHHALFNAIATITLLMQI